MATTPSRPPSLMTRIGRVWGWPAFFILPCLLGLGIFTYIPVLMSLGLSFSYWNLLGHPHWVGLSNYSAVLQDPLFWKTLQNTVFFVVGSVTLDVTMALLLAVLLNRTVQGIGIFRTVFFLPVITPMVSVALVWGWLYDPNYGWLNAFLHLFGIKPIAWLYDKQWAMWAIILLRVWKDMGYNMVILLAGLQGIPTHLYESAALDGANAWQRFWRLTLPMLSPTLFFVITVSLINAFQAFDMVYLLTEGGPENSTQVLVYWLFKNAFQFYKVGPASAIAYILFMIILTLTVIQWQLRKRWVLHEADE
jgi:multiple sugar transport system permease protein